MITGPFIFERYDYENNHSNGVSEQKVWYRQSKPYKRPLPYRHASWKYDWAPGVDPRLIGYRAHNARAAGDGLVGNGDFSQYSYLYALAYDRLNKRVGDKCGWLLNVLEGGKSLEMIAARCKQLRSMWRNLRSFNIPALARDIGLHPTDPKLKKLRRNGVANNFANSWLELQFGWKPLLKDIYDSVQILQRDFPTAPVTGSATGSILSLPVYGGTASQIESVRIHGTLRITNPSLFLANQLGLINPVAVLWDAVPFSFVVDWFIPVNKFLNSLTNEVGCSIVDVRVTTQRSVVGQTSDGATFPDGTGAVGISLYEGRFFQRTTGELSVPSLLSRLKRPNFDAWKAVTSLALLTQQMKLR